MRAYQVACVLILVLATGCGSSGGGATPTTTSVPPTTAPVASATVAPPTPTEAPTIAPTETAAETATVAETATALETTTADATTTPDDGSTLTGEKRTDLQGAMLFSRVNDAGLWIYTPQDGMVRRVIEDAHEARWSPGGTQFVFVRADGVYIADASSGSAQRVYEGTDLHAPVWSPDSTRLAFEVGTYSTVDASKRAVWTLDLSTSEARKVGDGTDPAWSPDGTRIAYVTVPAGDDAPRRTELRVVDWQGENTRTIVDDLPEGTPSIGIPDSQVPPADLEHVMEQPFWNTAGDAIYVVSYVSYQVLTGFSIWERANVEAGGSTFIGELPEVVRTTPAPNREAVLFSASSARGDTWLVARGVPADATAAPDTAAAWAETPQGEMVYAPAWSPDSAAVAYIQCDLDDTTRCDLLVRTVEGDAVVVANVYGGTATGDTFTAPTLDWAGNG